MNEAMILFGLILIFVGGVWGVILLSNKYDNKIEPVVLPPVINGTYIPKEDHGGWDTEVTRSSIVITNIQREKQLVMFRSPNSTLECTVTWAWLQSNYIWMPTCKPPKEN